MSGAALIGNMASQDRPNFVRERFPFALQDPSTSGSQSTNWGNTTPGENFRQRWQGIIGALHAADTLSSEDVGAPSDGELRKDFGRIVSAKNSTARAWNGVQGTKAEPEPLSAGDFPEIARGSGFPARLGTVTDASSCKRFAPSTKPHEFLTRRNTVNSDWRISSQRSEKALTENTKPHGTTIIAADPQAAVYAPQAPQATSLARSETVPQQSLPVSGLPNPSAAAQGRFDAQATNADAFLPAIVDKPQAGTLHADNKNEFATVPEISPSQPTAHDTIPVRDDPASFGSAGPVTAEAAQTHFPGKNEQSNPLNLGSIGSASSAGTLLQPSATAGSVPIAETAIESDISGAGRMGASPRPRAGIPETNSFSAAKTRASSNLHGPVSDLASASIEPAHGAPIPFAEAGMATPAGLEAHAAPIRQEPSAHEPFAAMDSGINDGSPRWIFTGSHKAEAGFQDPSLGWISVRAESAAGGIHADVVAPTDAAAHELSGHIAGLNAHLASHYEHLNMVTLSAPEAARNSGETMSETSQGYSGDFRDGGQRQGQENSNPASPGEPALQLAHRLSEQRASAGESAAITGALNPSTHLVSVVA